MGVLTPDAFEHALGDTPQRRLDRLERRLVRERAARLEAEAIAEAGLRRAYLAQQRIELLQRVAAQANEAADTGEALRFAELRRQLRVVAHRGESAYLRAATKQGLELESTQPRGSLMSGVADKIDQTPLATPHENILAALGLANSTRKSFSAPSPGSGDTPVPGHGDSQRGGLMGGMMLSSHYSEGVVGLGADAASGKERALIAAADGEDRLTTQEIVTMCNLLLLAGNLTTTDLIGNCVLALLRHPEQLATVQANPARMADAIEETLRLDPPVVQSLRIPLEPREIGGCPVRAGEAVTTFLIAAGQDPALHKDPLRFDIDRADKTHFAFGGGVHFCLGAPLARAEAEIALTRLFARFPNLALTGDPIERNVSAAFNGVQQLWVRP